MLHKISICHCPTWLEMKSETCRYRQPTLIFRVAMIFGNVIGGTLSRPTNFTNFCFRDVVVDEAFGWIWKSKCTMKWKMFCWLLLADRLNSRNMLRRRHFMIANDGYTCLLCASPPKETVEHLFFYCPFASRCWNTLG